MARRAHALRELHSWSLSPSEAATLQARLRARLRLAWDGRAVATVGGVDVAIRGDRARAAIVVLSYPELAPVASATADLPVTFPYVPGLLAFREGAVILEAWRQLPLRPGLVLIDGQGIAHPRGFGLAAHIGLWLRRPTVGVAKSRLYGLHAVPGPARGERADLCAEDESGRIVGTVLRTRPGTKPLYVSPGHLIDVAHAADFVLSCCTRYRLPEPTRWAHQVAAGVPFPPR